MCVWGNSEYEGYSLFPALAPTLLPTEASRPSYHTRIEKKRLVNKSFGRAVTPPLIMWMTVTIRWTEDLACKPQSQPVELPGHRGVDIRAILNDVRIVR
jgi:hypothetical protein